MSNLRPELYGLQGYGVRADQKGNLVYAVDIVTALDECLDDDEKVITRINELRDWLATPAAEG